MRFYENRLNAQWPEITVRLVSQRGTTVSSPVESIQKQLNSVDDDDDVRKQSKFNPMKSIYWINKDATALLGAIKVVMGFCGDSLYCDRHAT